MANPHKGEVEIKVPDLGLFTIVLDCNAMAELQEAMGLATGPQGDLAFLERLPHIAAGQAHGVRQGFFHGAQKHHGPRGDGRVLTLADAGEVIGAMGIDATRLALAQALTLAMPEPEGATPPPKAASPGAGTD